MCEIVVNFDVFLDLLYRGLIWELSPFVNYFFGSYRKEKKSNFNGICWIRYYNKSNETNINYWIDIRSRLGLSMLVIEFAIAPLSTQLVIRPDKQIG